MRRREKRKLLKQHPNCIFCGGSRAATTVEHLPGKAFFPEKDRPKGLEFPSCLECNQGTKWAENIAALLASTSMDDSTDHFEKKLTHTKNNHPQVLAALDASIRQIKNAKHVAKLTGTPVAAIDVRSPLIQRAMLVFGGKLATGLHWIETHQILSNRAKLGVVWTTNQAQFKDSVPSDFLALLPNSRTLRQGAKNAEHLFQFSSGITNEDETTAHWVAFGTTLLFTLTASELYRPSALPDSHVISPGAFTEGPPTLREWRPENWSVQFPEPRD